MVTDVLTRARRRIVAHRREAFTMLGFLLAVSGVAAATRAFARLDGLIGGREGAALPGALVIGFACLWMPLMVIDARRCTRESRLRALVEADFNRHQFLTRAKEKELAATRSSVDSIVAQGGPRLAYQPIVEMATAKVVGYEALSRFPGERPPDQWFNAASTVGLGVELELVAIRGALAGFRFTADTGYLSVNASPATLRDPRLFQLLEAADPGRTVVELTEHLPVDDYCEHRAAISRLRSIGVRLAVDDAGAGYASFRHVVDLSPDIIKIDGSLVRGIDVDPKRRSLLVAFVSFASDLGATLIAECVERAEEAELLQAWGIQYGQGWLFGRPEGVPAPSATAPAVTGLLTG